MLKYTAQNLIRINDIIIFALLIEYIYHKCFTVASTYMQSVLFKFLGSENK